MSIFSKLDNLEFQYIRDLRHIKIRESHFSKISNLDNIEFQYIRDLRHIKIRESHFSKISNLDNIEFRKYCGAEFGIFVDSPGASLTGGSGPSITVTILGVTVSNIGNYDPITSFFSPNGVQQGIGIIYDSGASGPLVQGSIVSSTVNMYQKGGIVVNHNSNVTTTGNTVTGLGPVLFIAQNGIEYARDAMGVIRGNMVSNNFYSGKTGVLADGSPCGGANPACPPGRQYVSTGILLVLIDPNSIQRGQNDVSNGNQRNYAVITDSPLD